ncbi:ketopantoate reductase family protein [Pseudomonas sp. SC11]|uniref:ketopantoate reductase family protein n=1 Tax=Pseudomonas sp. SC11 TaxID=326927 RepID=UPI00399A7159
MKVAIVGAGAMGGLFGARLALGGHDVTLVEASQALIEAVQQHGLRLVTLAGEQRVRLPIGRAAAISGSFDLLVIFTKGFHTAAAIASVRHLVGPTTWALSVQNGLGNAQLIASVVPAERVIVGMTNLPADVIEPGVVHSEGEGHVTLWSNDGADSPTLHEVASALDNAGLPCRADPQVQVAIWEKVAFNAVLNAVCAVTRQTVGAVGACDSGRRLSASIVGETVAVARAAGIEVDEGRVIGALEHAFAHHHTHKPSMLQDLEAGRRTEIDFINGAVVARAEALGVQTPVLRTLLDLVKLSETVA